MASVLAVGRRMADDLMVDACTIVRRAGTASFNQVTGRSVLASTPVYAGRCQVRIPQAQPATPEAGERTAVVLTAIVKVPVTVVGIQPGDIVTVTASAHDPDLVGRTFRILGLHHKTWSTARKLDVEETTA